MRSISWDEFERYIHCPQWYMWSHIPPTKEITNPPLKDTQHLIRGNATQAMVGKIFESPDWRSLKPSQLFELFEEHLSLCVIKNWIDKTETNEKPKASTLEICQRIRNNLSLCYPKLIEHLGKHFSDLSKVQVRTEFSIEAPWDASGELNLNCRLDMLFGDHEKSVIYEGKATSRPDMRTNDQIYWYTDVFRKSFKKHLAGSYYLFYEKNTIREAPLNGKFQEWLIYRDALLKRLLSGDYKAIPTRTSCHICSYRYYCPDVYTPKKREPKSEGSAFENTRRTNLL